MTELWLTFTDENGAVKRISVDREIFTVGRHSENDFSAASGKLSRQHLKIERFGDVFLASDAGSSNGTTLNGANLTKPTALKHGDELNLGGGLKIEIEFVSDARNKDDFFFDEDEFESRSAARETNESSASPAPQIAAEKGVSAASKPSAISSKIFWLAPVFGVLILLFVGGLFYAFSGRDKMETVRTNDDFVYSENKSSGKKEINDAEETPTPKVVSTNENSSGNSNGNSASTATPEIIAAQPTPKVSGDAEKIEQSSAAFMRQIAQNDPKAFLTGKQIEIVGAKINQFRNSNALAANLKAAKRDVAQFQAPANSQNLKPQFLAVAALAKIGNAGGNPLSVAQTMLPVLGELRITLDNKLADDNLLIIAAYEQGAAGRFRALQSVIEAVSKKSTNVSPREIRTVWFLKENGKLTDAEFEFAMRFLAIGTIAQDPKSFGVNADAITFKMRRFYASKEYFSEQTLTLSLAETRHLRDVLRLRTGEKAQVFDGAGKEFLCEIVGIGKKETLLKIIEEVAPSAPESSLDLTLAVALLKGEKFDLVVQKAVELGAAKFVPIETKRADVKLKDSEKKLERWRKIIVDASKQSGRARLMQIETPIDFYNFINNSVANRIDGEHLLLFAERNGESFSNVKSSKKITAVVGSEGGWEDAEIASAQESGFQIVTLKGRILRAETAAISIAAILQHRFGDFI